MNKISLSGGLDKDDDAHSINSIHSVQSSISSAASELSDKDPGPDRADAISLTHIVVTVSPPAEDVVPDDQSQTSEPQVWTWPKNSLRARSDLLI